MQIGTLCPAHKAVKPTTSVVFFPYLLRNQLKSQNINDVNNHLYTYAIGTMYMDIIQECEKLGDYVVNVVEARMGVRQHEA